MDNRYRKIIKDYKYLKEKYPDKLLEFCRKSSLKDAVEAAAKASFAGIQKHSHQRRIKQLILNKFSINLISDLHKIKKAYAFPDLMIIIDQNKIKGIGELAIYDAAHRIGANLGIKPDKVYLHSGTKIGARKLLMNNHLSRFIDKSVLPKIFHSLENSEIEDILCIYKDDFDLSKQFNGKFLCNYPGKSLPNNCG